MRKRARTERFAKGAAALSIAIGIGALLSAYTSAGMDSFYVEHRWESAGDDGAQRPASYDTQPSRFEPARFVKADSIDGQVLPDPPPRETPSPWPSSRAGY